jgi:hypothetical protein
VSERAGRSPDQRSTMNTANLQLQGVLLALYALLNFMRQKGVLNQQEIERALETAEANALADATRVTHLSDANLEAILFPIRFLRCANSASNTTESFTTIAQLVGETKPDRPHRSYSGPDGAAP